MDISKRFNDRHKNEKTRKTASNIILCIFAAFNVCFFTPIDIFFANADELAFPIKLMSLYLGIITVAVAAALFLGCVLIRGKANGIYRAVIFAASLALYIQGNFLSINMGKLLGDDYRVSVGRTVLDIAVWAIIFAAVFIIRRKFSEQFEKAVTYVSAAVIFIQLVALVSAFIQCMKHSQPSTISTLLGGVQDLSINMAACTNDDLDVYSSEKNFIIIMPDEYDSHCFDEALKQGSPAGFDGFTYYTNTVGMYHWTQEAIPYAFINSSVYSEGDETFLQTVAQNYEARVYADYNIPDPKLMIKYCDNYINVVVLFRDGFSYTKSLLELTMFRVLPEPLKPFVIPEYKGLAQIDYTLPDNKERYRGDNLFFYNNFPRELTITDTPQFKYIYLDGLHLPRNMNKDMQRVNDTVSLEDTTDVVNKMIGEYLETLKEYGVYDNSDIFIMADHGVREEYKDCSVMTPLLMYKPAYSTDTGIKISNAPISHADLFPTYVKLAGGEPEERTIFDISEDEERVRRFAGNNANINIIGNIKGEYKQSTEN